jgi:hypothetical protein
LPGSLPGIAAVGRPYYDAHLFNPGAARLSLGCVWPRRAMCALPSP